MIAWWHWWCGQMISLMPGRAAGQWLACWRGGRLTLLERRGGTLVEAEPPTDAVLTLSLPDRRPWRRHLSLPRAAGPYLRTVLSQDMDRRSPWRAEQIYFTAKAAKSEEPGKLSVTLTVLPRHWAEPALDALRLRGLTADRLQLDEDGAMLSLVDGEPVFDAGRGNRAAAAFAVLVGAALISLIAQSLWGVWLDRELAVIRHDATVARALATETARLRRSQHFASLRREESPSAIAVLNRVSRALPDDSWLEEFTFKNRQVTLSGVSAQPARLLGLLQEAGFSGAAFRAPVTPAEGGGQHFQITADVTGSDHDFR